MTVIGAGGKFGTGAYKVSGGLHGVGVSAVNALSERMKTTVYRDGYVWEQEYVQGRPVYDVRKARPMEDGEGTGTVQTFKPDFSILDQNDFNFETMAHRFREMAFVTRKVTITLRDERVKPIPQEGMPSGVVGPEQGLPAMAGSVVEVGWNAPRDKVRVL
jgi:DNA gyrase subunit B